MELMLVSFTDAEILKGKAEALSAKTTEFHAVLLRVTEIADQIRDLVGSIGEDAPLVGNLVDLAIDNLGTANRQIGQATDIVETWAKKL